MTKPDQTQIIPNNAKKNKREGTSLRPPPATSSSSDFPIEKINAIHYDYGREEIQGQKGAKRLASPLLTHSSQRRRAGWAGADASLRRLKNWGQGLRERRGSELTPMRRVLISFLGLYLESRPCKFSSANASTHPRRSARYLTFE